MPWGRHGGLMLEMSLVSKNLLYVLEMWGKKKKSSTSSQFHEPNLFSNLAIKIIKQMSHISSQNEMWFWKRLGVYVEAGFKH